MLDIAHIKSLRGPRDWPVTDRFHGLNSTETSGQREASQEYEKPFLSTGRNHEEPIEFEVYLFTTI
jgi:hypothetical protein